MSRATERSKLVSRGPTVYILNISFENIDKRLLMVILVVLGIYFYTNYTYLFFPPKSIGDTESDPTKSIIV